MNLVQSVQSGFRHYMVFSGRACRSEFWYWMLFVMLISIPFFAISISGLSSVMHDPRFGTPGYAPQVSGSLTMASSIQNIISLALLLPNLSMIVRRLHDVDRSGWWFWFALVPFIGPIMLLVWQCTRGTPGQNRFGSDPLQPNLRTDLI